jgi:hypothetical protein
MPEPVFMKLGMYIMATESISMSYFINPSLQSVCLYIPLSMLGNGSVNTLPRQRIHKTKIFWTLVFSAVRAMSKESLWVGVYASLLLLSNNSVETFLRQYTKRKHFGPIVFSAVRAVSKESVGLSVYLPIVARQRLGKHVSAENE